MENPCISNHAVDLGSIGYSECLELQLKLVSLRRSGDIGNTLLFLEHDPPVYTIGRKADPANWPGLDPVRTERGGDVTYHSPGQLVIYPIFDLNENGRVDVRSFVMRVESCVMAALEENGVSAYIGKDEPGIWTVGENRKVASVGMAIDRGISYHGIAINITEEPLNGFLKINPCGLDPKVMGHVGVDRRIMVESMLKAFNRYFPEMEEISREKFYRTIEKLEPGTEVSH